MQSRPIIYTLQQIQSADMLNGWVNSLIGDANSLQAVLGATGTVISNLVVTPQDPASLTLNISNGFIASLQTVDASAYGSLPANTTQVLQLGGNLVTSVLLDNAGLSAGQAQYILIQAGYIQLDSDPVVLPYVNISNPAAPYYGPANSGIAQDTVRNAVCDIQVKYGTPATAGSEVAPSPDAGYVTVAYVDLAHGQVAVTGGEILNPNLVPGGTDSPVLAGLLQAHHSGEPGQAPQIELGTTGPVPQEVRGELPMANLFASNVIGAVTAFRTGSGNPNGVLAGNANRNGVCDSYYDVTNNAFYMCTTTGSSSTAVWTNTNTPPSLPPYLKSFGAQYNWNPLPMNGTIPTGDYYTTADWVQNGTITIGGGSRCFFAGSVTFNGIVNITAGVENNLGGSTNIVGQNPMSGLTPNQYNGQGPGGGPYTLFSNSMTAIQAAAGGGGHGGAGGMGGSQSPGAYNGNGGATYNITNPQLCGSGGGSGLPLPDAIYGGPGGGSIYIETLGNITLLSSANISADGLAGGNLIVDVNTGGGGGGSGGGIDIRAIGNIVIGAGAIIHANGAVGGNGGCGGGGGGGGVIQLMVSPYGSVTNSGTVQCLGAAAGTGGLGMTAGAVGVVLLAPTFTGSRYP